MILTKSSALVACLVLLFSSFSALTKAQDLVPGQVYSTGNIVLPTNQGGPTPWVNGVYQDNLTCWGWGDKGYCGPNPIVRPGNNINFSFGWTDLYQQQSIASVLPYTGTGLKLDGYNFKFTAKNGNGWDDGRVDVLYAYVQFNSTAGDVLANHTHNLTSKFNWTNFNYDYKFDSPFAAKDVDNVRYGFVGKDNNFWAGPYGPEVINVSLSLKYSLDPCASNVLSSPTCPGYNDAINSYTNNTKQISPNSSTSEEAPVHNINHTPPPPHHSSNTHLSEQRTETSPPLQSNEATHSKPHANHAPSGSGNSATPSANNPQPKIGEVNVSGSPPSNSKPTLSTSQVLSIVSKEQSRISKLETSTAQSAVEQAKQESNKVVSESLSVVSSIQSQNHASNQALITSVLSHSHGSGLSVGSHSAGNGMVVFQQPSIVQHSNQSTYSLTTVVNPAFNQSTISVQVAQSDVRSFRSESVKLESQSTAVEVNQPAYSSTGPLNNIFNQNNNNLIQQIPQPTQTGSVVRSNVVPNEAAGGKDISSIASVPNGYENYTSLVLRDVAFYKPEEIYKGQKTVDNVRALRQLSSDRLHQEMVNQQYGR